MSRKTTRRGVLRALASAGVGATLAALTLAGCGGGGSGSGGAASGGAGVPTDATRSRVQSLHDLTVRGMSQSGFQTESMALTRNGFLAGPRPGGGGGAGRPGDDSAPPAATPMVGAFLRNIAALPPPARLARMRRHGGGGSGGGRPEGSGPGRPPVDEPPAPPALADPTFYFDYYLGLYVQITEAPGRVTYALFEDEAKTKTAGYIETVQPTDYATYPQTYRSVYRFTAGYLAGSFGSSDNVMNADGSGRSAYSNTYGDGWKDEGESSWSARGDYSWKSRTETGDGQWTESSGTFRADGSGGTRTETSDGYKSGYTFNADGSGRGRIEGSDPGMPVTISWDRYGNTTIRYADGSVERIPGWGGHYGGYIGGGIGVRPVPMNGLPVPDAPNGKASNEATPPPPPLLK